MSATDFLPRREADLRNWSVVFHKEISEQYGALGLTAEDVAAYAALHEAFLAAYSRVSSGSTRTPSAIIAKNEAQKALRKKARQLARIVHSHRYVTDGQKAALGLTVRRPGGKVTPIPRPSSAPLMSVESQTASRVTIRLRDREHPTRRGRPVGVRAVNLMAYYGHDAPDDPSQWTLLRQTTKVVNTITLPSSLPPGTPVWIAARWANPRGQLGPAAQPLRVYVQFTDANALVKKDAA